eukprot:TRINITY_DN60659_c0_g1_i1.p1 TRINITY_DN60659_c0_g1~~TRINITY_DN60659_c0_g1_i1.p1  ORF type:complete len:308 (+),score=86.65 TRINITY_DN60659_c0_g1_i1:68-925(+)
MFEGAPAVGSPQRYAHEEWVRRVGLHGTHNQEPFEVTRTVLDVNIDHSTGDAPCLVVVRHSTRVTHHTAEFWFPISDLGGVKGFSVEVDGAPVRGRLVEAVGEFSFRPHERGRPMAPEKLYYLHATGDDSVNEVLSELRRGSEVVVQLTFRSRLIPVEMQKGRPALSFMLPIAPCFPRGVDSAAARVAMPEYIRDIYPAMREQNLQWQRKSSTEATVSFRKVGNHAIDPLCDLFIMNIECGPKVVRDWDWVSVIFLVVFVAALIAVHGWSSREGDHRVFESRDGQ